MRTMSVTTVKTAPAMVAATYLLGQPVLGETQAYREWVNERAIPFSRDPSVVPPRYGTMHDCWENAYRLASADRRLFYLEGIARPRPGADAAGHAFCVTSSGVVVDPTWPDGCDYRGVVFPTAWMDSCYRRAGWFIDGVVISVIEVALHHLFPDLDMRLLEKQARRGRWQLNDAVSRRPAA